MRFNALLATLAALLGTRAALASGAPLPAGAADAAGAVSAPGGGTAALATSASSTASPKGDGGDEGGPPEPAVYGLYPLWEETGAVDAHGSARVGLRRAQVVLGRLTVATDPYLDLYGTFNAGLKLGLVRRGPLRLALQLGGYRVPTAAETRGIGNVNAGAFANPYDPLTLVPLSAAGTWMATRTLHLHATATFLQTFSSTHAMETTTGGITGWVEWFASPRHSVRLHAGTEGWPTATMQHAGVSIGFRTDHVALQGGYARRFAPEGTSANTLMFDVALLFP